MTDVADLADPVVSADELLAGALRPDDAPTDDQLHDADQPWQVDGRKTADWALLKIRAAHARYADDTAGARDQIAVLEARIADLQAHIDRAGERRDQTVAFFEGRLTDWLRRERQAALDAGGVPDKAPKSIALTGGAVRSRAGRDRVEVVDAGQVVLWSESGSGAQVARWEPVVDKRLVARHIAATGEVPPGVEHTPASEDDRSFFVKVDS